MHSMFVCMITARGRATCHVVAGHGIELLSRHVVGSTYLNFHVCAHHANLDGAQNDEQSLTLQEVRYILY